MGCATRHCRFVLVGFPAWQALEQREEKKSMMKILVKDRNGAPCVLLKKKAYNRPKCWQ